jgi:hypothetical protein
LGCLALSTGQLLQVLQIGRKPGESRGSCHPQADHFTRFVADKRSVAIEYSSQDFFQGPTGKRRKIVFQPDPPQAAVVPHVSPTAKQTWQEAVTTIKNLDAARAASIATQPSEDDPRRLDRTTMISNYRNLVERDQVELACQLIRRYSPLTRHHCYDEISKAVKTWMIVFRYFCHVEVPDSLRRLIAIKSADRIIFYPTFGEKGRGSFGSLENALDGVCRGGAVGHG